MRPIQFKSRGRAARWFVKHRDLITVFGGLILFATFVVNDVLRQQEKDVVNTIDSAESIYLIRDSNLALRKEIDQLDANINMSRRKILRADRSKHKEKQTEAREFIPVFDGSEDPVVRLLDESNVEVDNLQRLVAKASPTAEHLTEFGRVYWEWDKLRMQFFAKPLPLLDEKPTEDAKTITERDQAYYLSLWLINSKISMVGAEILDDAHYTKEKLEHRVKIFTPISYVLFGVGVVLTIVSKLFGVDPEADAA